MATGQSPQKYRTRPGSTCDPCLDLQSKKKTAVRHFTDCAMHSGTGTSANSENADEMQHNAAFHKDLNCLLRLKQPSGTEIHNFEISTCGPLKYKMDVLYLLYQDVWENPSEFKGLIFGECSFKSWRFV